MPRIDWAKSGLRTAYLVEGHVFLGGLRVVRWCGPKVRTGSGTVAITTMPTYGWGRERRPASWEARLSRCVCEQSMGGLRQRVQRVSDVTMNVDIGDTDNADPTVSNITDLRDLVHLGRWKGQTARLIVVDLDDVESYEVLVDGTWDRDPTSLTQTSFKMTIDAGAIVPPTLPWPSWQIPEEPPDAWDDSGGSAPRQWPGGGVARPYRLNPEHRGKWIGFPFGGNGTLNYTGVWAEVVPYGKSTTYDFIFLAPRLDQFALDFAYENDDGEIIQISRQASRVILCFNQTDPTRGPVGSCAKIEGDADFFWYASSHRIFAKLLGGQPLARPPGYSPVGPGGNPWTGDNGPWPPGGEARPDVPMTYDTHSEAPGIFQDMISDPAFLDSPADLHPDAVTDLFDAMVQGPGSGQSFNQFRKCRIPLAITAEPPSFLDIIKDFLASIPADLVYRYDPASRMPKLYAKVRPAWISTADHVLTAGDLVESSPPGVTLNDDPDGIYANRITFSTAYLGEPIATSNPSYSPDDAALEIERGLSLELESLYEQGSAGTNQTIVDETSVEEWNFYSNEDLEQTALYYLAESARPQKVSTVTLGAFAFGWNLGDSARYIIDSVLNWPGQIRTMRLDLDSQRVTLTLYHWRPDLRVVEEVVETHKTAENTAEGYDPDRLLGPR